MKKKKEPKRKPSVKIYSDPYYYARSLYFDVKIFPHKGIVQHVYTSSEIACRVAAEFNIRVPDSTIRRWSTSPDKDFGERSWAEEWDRRVAEGFKNGLEGYVTSEHAKKTSQPTESKELTPMERLSEMNKKCFLNNIEIAMGVDNLVLYFVGEIEATYQKTGKIDINKLKALQPYAVNAKELLNESFEKLKKLEGVQEDEKWRDLVPLKDPQARERVRQAFRSLIEFGLERGEELEKEREEMQGKTEECRREMS